MKNKTTLKNVLLTNEAIKPRIKKRGGMFYGTSESGEELISGRYIVDTCRVEGFVTTIDPFYEDVFIVNDIEKHFKAFEGEGGYKLYYADAQDEDEDEDEATPAETPEQRFRVQYVKAIEDSKVYQSGLEVFLVAEELGINPKVDYVTAENMSIKTSLHTIYIDTDGEIRDSYGEWDRKFGWGVVYMEPGEFTDALRDYMTKKTEPVPEPSPDILASIKSALASGELTEKQVLGLLLENKEG